MPSSMIATVKAEGRKFCETTSIRGVPRIVKSKNKGLFYCWLSGVLVCSGCLFWQLYVVLNRYLSYPVNTLYSQAPDAQNPIFPDITVCNMNPLVNEAYNGMLYSEYLDILGKVLNFEQVQKVAESHGLDNITEYDFNYFKANLVSSSAYFNNFPIDLHMPMHDSNRSMTLDCSYFMWNYSQSITVCMENIQPIWDPDYYKCYTFSVDRSEINFTRGFSAIFNVQTFRGTEMSPYYLGLVKSHAAGLKVLVHAPGTKPDMKLGLSVNPGTETTIEVSQTTRIILPAPYGACTSEQTLGDDITYTQAYCTDTCVQESQNVYGSGCLDSSLQFTEAQLAEVNYTLCGNLSLNQVNSTINWDQFYTFIKFISSSTDDTDCRASCMAPCLEYQYSTSVSSAAWPDTASQITFYGAYIRGQEYYGTKFSAYEPLYQSAQDNTFDDTDENTLQQLSLQGLLQSNFMQLNVRFDSTRFNIQRDTPAFTKDAMGAQIGGVLSLWLGVTIMLLFEIVEFFYILVSAILKAKTSDMNVQPLQSEAIATAKQAQAPDPPSPTHGSKVKQLEA